MLQVRYRSLRAAGIMFGLLTLVRPPKDVSQGRGKAAGPIPGGFAVWALGQRSRGMLTAIRLTTVGRGQSSA